MSKSPGDPSLFDRYLDILSVSPARPSSTALEELVAAHMTRIPFENISKLYYYKRDRLKYIPSLDQYLSGIEQFSFGGTCFSSNYYFNQLLRHLGFQAILCGADMLNPDVHLVNIVTVDGREFLVDLGYAAPFLKPLPRDLTVDYEVQLGCDCYTLRPRDKNGCSRIDHYRDGELIHGYTAKPEPRQIDYFSSTIEDSFRKESSFMNSLLLVRLLENRSLVIRNLSVIESEGDSSKIRSLSDKSELPSTIEQGFGIPADIVSEVVSLLTGIGGTGS